MGDDKKIVDAARVSYANQKNSENREMNDKDTKLLQYLLEHHHESPLEHLSVTLHVKTPIFVARQIIRHRHQSYNEISRRYTTKFADEFYVPDHIRKPDPKNKQGSVRSTNLLLASEDIKTIENAYEIAYRTYEKLLKHGVAREMARMVLPVGQYTQFYWTINMRSFVNFYKLRSDAHAQWETQEYARAAGRIIKEIYPVLWDMLEKSGMLKL